MKKLITYIIVSFFITSTAALAQQQKKVVFNWQKEYLTEAGIAPDIQEKITEINLKSTEEIKSIRNDSSLNDDQKKEKLQEIYNVRYLAIKALITNEQMDKIKAIRDRVNKEASN